MQIEITNDMKEKSVWINYLKGDENHEYKCDAWKLKACWWIQDEEMKAKVTSEVKNKESECVRKWERWIGNLWMKVEVSPGWMRKWERWWLIDEGNLLRIVFVLNEKDEGNLQRIVNKEWMRRKLI